jgi:hypothetical protein
MKSVHILSCRPPYAPSTVSVAQLALNPFLRSPPPPFLPPSSHPSIPAPSRPSPLSPITTILFPHSPSALFSARIPLALARNVDADARASCMKRCGGAGGAGRRVLRVRVGLLRAGDHPGEDTQRACSALDLSPTLSPSRSLAARSIFSRSLAPARPRLLPLTLSLALLCLSLPLRFTLLPLSNSLPILSPSLSFSFSPSPVL